MGYYILPMRDAAMTNMRLLEKVWIKKKNPAYKKQPKTFGIECYRV